MTEDAAHGRFGIRRLSGVAAIILAHFVAIACVMIALCKIVPTYGYVFEQLGTDVPDNTRRIIELSHSCLRQPLLITFFVVLTDTAILSVLALKMPDYTRLLSTYSHVVLVITTFAMLYIGAWLSHPVGFLVQ